ncbi:MAG: ERCC4 domain-containing protein [Candidatus Nanoarchaeia archaeon]
MEFKKEKLELRIYQQTILNSALNQNTLVVLPTGLGKTHIAIALAGLLYQKGKILMLAPTLPLVNQHAKTFAQFFSPPEELAVLSGKVEPKERENLWTRAKLIFATPQTIKHDLISGKINLKDLALLIFDEAHRASGEYPYSFIAKICVEQNPSCRILALTASPGTPEKTKELCTNLFLDKVEIRNRNHPEIAPYVKSIQTNFVLINLPQQFINIKENLEAAIANRVQIINSLTNSNLNLNKLSRKTLLNLKQELQKRFVIDKHYGRALSVCASLIKIQHALLLLTTESISAFCSYLNQIWNEASRHKTKTLTDITSDFRIRAAYSLALDLFQKGIEHPKIAALKDVVKKQISENPNSKILIFTEYRDNIAPILSALEMPGIAAHKFIGQASRLEPGMSQKTQAEIIERFKKGELNVLVCTSVAEEGIDIPAVNLVVFYSPLPSVIRTIQRRGRTGRTEVGKVEILITKNTVDEAYYWSTKRKEERLNKQFSEFESFSFNNISFKEAAPKKQGQQKLIDSIENKIEDKIGDKKNEIVIFVDSREPKLAEQLFLLGAKVIPTQLKVGDFIISERLGCERKTIEDFVASLIDGRLFAQAKELKETFARPFFVLEGEFERLFSVKNVSKQALYGALASLLFDWEIPIIFTKNISETALLLYTIANREQNKDRKNLLNRTEKPVLLPEAQLYFIESLPQIGPEVAKALLKYFGSPKAIVNATEEELKKVEGVGEKRAALLKQIFETIYKS